MAFQVANFALSFIAGLLYGLTDISAMLYLGFLVYVLLPAYLSAAVRRVHDHGKSGWFILVPFYNLYLFIIEGEATPNAHGAVPTNTAPQ